MIMKDFLTVKALNIVGMTFRGLMFLDMFVDTWIEIYGFQIKCNITKVYKYFVGILNSWIALPTKLNAQRIFMI